jgi:hypothetical protein
MLPLGINLPASPCSMATTAEATVCRSHPAAYCVAFRGLFVAKPQSVPLPHHHLFVFLLTRFRLAEWGKRRQGLLRLLVVAFLCVGVAAAQTATATKNVSVSQSDQGKPDVKVWVNTASGVYHCPGTRWYGSTKQGEYMTQADAQKKGYRPAYGKVCR